MLKEDYGHSREDIQDLSSRDALAAFFARLGYNTNDRLLQNTATMGFGSELLKSAITSIERLASEDGGLLEVYLVELKSVTVAVTRALAQIFRNLSVLHLLLVLTNDYQHLDFVLVERYTASNSQESPIPGLPSPLARQIGVRPRVLTINRLKPADVELRVLRRFSYTESDSLAQYDKLLSAYVVAEWSEPPLATIELLDILRKNKTRLGVSLTIQHWLTGSAKSTRKVCNECCRLRSNWRKRTA